MPPFDMSFKPTVGEQELLAETIRRPGLRLNRRELVAAVLVGSGFFIAVAWVWFLRPPHGPVTESAALCMLVLACATRVRFLTPFGYTVPTQLAFVPLLFATPLAIVPLAVVAALTLGSLPDVARGGVPPSRLMQVPGNSWFAIGPVAVFAIANVEPWHATPILLIIALAAQFVVDFTISAIRFAISEGATLASQLHEAWVYLIDAALSPIGLLAARDVRDSPVAALAILPLLVLLATFARERQQRLESMVELNNAYRGTALVLGDVVEADDGYTGEHCKSVVGLALELAACLELSSEQRRNLEFAALLHDVGKIAIPKDIINKPGPLDPQEWKIIKTHTLEGQQMLERVGGFMKDVGSIVRSHHERWDGHGYPDRLAGDAIPIEARIIACCDSWNAMRTDRAYRKALSHDAAMAELQTNAGSQFDPHIVQALTQILEPMPDMLATSKTHRPRRKAVERATPSPHLSGPQTDV
jgi:putative nucleotidyltransferase with HDIG domain